MNEVINEVTKEALALEITKAKFSKNENLDATSSYDWVKVYKESLNEIESALKNKTENISDFKIGFAR